MTRPYHKNPDEPRWRKTGKTPRPNGIPRTVGMAVTDWGSGTDVVYPVGEKAPPVPLPVVPRQVQKPGAVIGAELSRWCLSENHGWCRGVVRRYMTAPIDREVSERCRCECHGKFV